MNVTLQSRLLAAIVFLVCGAIGVAAAEGFLRLLAPEPLYYSMWFTPGIHRPDEELGFVFTPDYRGSMRHPDRTWRVPLALNESGLRLPMSTQQPEPGQDVAIFGGYSMAFSYGLTDAESLAGQIADQSSSPITVHTLSWPGFGLPYDFRKYQRFLEGNVEPRVIVLCLFKDADYRLVQEPFQSQLPEFEENFFQYHDDIVLDPKGRISRSLGRTFYRSYLVAGVSRYLDVMDARFRNYGGRFLFPSRESNAVDAQEQPAAIDDPLPGSGNFITHLQQYSGAQILVVAIPEHSDVRHGPAELQPIVPEGVAVLDLRDSLRGPDADWKAQAHYGPQSARILAAEISTALQPCLRRDSTCEESP